MGSGSMARVRSSGVVWWDGSIAFVFRRSVGFLCIMGQWVTPACRSSRYLLGPCGFHPVFCSWLQFLVVVPLPVVEAQGLLACSWAQGVPFFLLSSFPSFSLVRFSLPAPRYPLFCFVSLSLSLPFPFLLQCFSPAPSRVDWIGNFIRFQTFAPCQPRV